MRKKTLVLSLLLACAPAFGQSSYDLVIVGGNPGGIMAAISAARMGKKSVILERTRYVGGLPANGLGATDIATRAATTGLFREFVDGVKQHYIDTYGPGSEQVKVCSDGYHFEPSVGARIFQKMLNGQKDKITVLTMRQFDAEDEKVMTESNQEFQVIPIAEQLFHQYFRAAREDEEEYELLLAIEILEQVQHDSRIRVSNCNIIQFGRILQRNQVPSIHAKRGNVYKVVRIKPKRA